MRCPACHSADTSVIDSRLIDDGDAVRRRRKCNDCDERYTTYERAEISLPRVVKSNAERVAFDEQKLRKGLQLSLEKRPVETSEIESALSSIMRRARSAAEGEVDSRQIGEWVMDELRKLDDVAYIRFASVYRSFQDVSAFQDEIDRLKSTTTLGGNK